MEQETWKSLGTVMDEQFTVEAAQNRPTHIKTGFCHLDEVLSGGLPPGLTVLGGSPGLGKSTFTLQLAEHTASQGMPVLYFSMEMSSEWIAAKAICRHIFRQCSQEAERITANQLIGGDVSSEQWKQIDTARKAHPDCLYVIEESRRFGKWAARRTAMPTIIRLSEG